MNLRAKIVQITDFSYCAFMSAFTEKHRKNKIMKIYSIIWFFWAWFNIILCLVPPFDISVLIFIIIFLVMLPFTPILLAYKKSLGIPRQEHEINKPLSKIGQHDVFISYSTKDKAIADAVCAALEASKIRCWVAPRDIVPGEKWASAITKAISSSRIMVLIFSLHSNTSEDVLNELLLARDAGVIIIPLKIGNILPNGDMEFYLKRTHWLDAIDPPTEKQIQKLVETVDSFLQSVKLNWIKSENKIDDSKK